MFELIKIAWDVVVLRDAMGKGEMTARVWGAAALFLLVVVSIGLPTILYYEAGGLLGLVLIGYFWLAIRWRLRLKRGQAGSA
jgi:hypothetical protein